MADTDGFLERHHFLLRRLHSLTGIAPISLFLMFHLTTNASIVWGRLAGHDGLTGADAAVGTFQHEVNFIHSMPMLLLIEIFGLWLPIGFHAVLGVAYALGGKNNTTQYAYQANRRYALQRLSGYFGFLFIFYHVATLRWGWTFLVPGGTQWTGEHAASTMAAAIRGSAEGFTAAGMIVAIFYMVGVSLLVFHLANGLWTSAITWGLTTTEQAQKRWGHVCTAIGAGLMLAAWSSVIGFATLDYDAARAVELGLQGAEHAPEPASEVMPGMAAKEIDETETGG